LADADCSVVGELSESCEVSFRGRLPLTISRSRHAQERRVGLADRTDAQAEERLLDLPPQESEHVAGALLADREQRVDVATN
jgi:hypothetical protein